MRAVSFAIAAAAAFVPATAWAGWNTASYAATFQTLTDIRNTLTRWCATEAAHRTNQSATRLEDACGTTFDGQNIQGAQVYVTRSHNDRDLITATRWTFVLSNERKAYLFVLVDETRHQSALRDREQDQTSTRMEVSQVYRGQWMAEPDILTAGTAWRGRKAGGSRRTDRDPPAFEDVDAGLGDAIKSLYALRFRVREAYRVK